MKRKSGSAKFRANDANFHSKNPGAYKYLLQETWRWIEQLSFVNYPANSERFFHDLITRLAKKEKISFSTEDLNTSVKKLLEFRNSCKQHSVEFQAVSASIEHAFPSAVTNKLLPSKLLSPKSFSSRYFQFQSICTGMYNGIWLVTVKYINNTYSPQTVCIYDL